LSPDGADVLTLEPLIEAVRSGVERAGWSLSGLQKTTSHHFEGRWAGDATRSAYLFFHRTDGPDWASLDVYLDETPRGLTGDLALVVDARALGELGDPETALADLATISARELPDGYRRPLTVRLRLDGPTAAPREAETEIRFKLRIPKAAIDAGSRALDALAAETARAFGCILAAPGLVRFLE